MSGRVTSSELSIPERKYAVDGKSQDAYQVMLYLLAEMRTLQCTIDRKACLLSKLHPYEFYLNRWMREMQMRRQHNE
jgi:hypothetical protein